MADEEKSSIPDIYFDGIGVFVSLFGVNFTLTLTEPHPDLSDPNQKPNIKELIVARTSPEHAKLFAMLLTKQLKAFEQKLGSEIKLPDQLYKELGLDKTDW